MDCEQAQQEILGWEDLDAELAAHPEIAAHVAGGGGCGKCQELIGKLKKLEAAAREMALPEGYATVPPAFLRRVAMDEKNRGGAKLRRLMRRAVAAVIIVAVGLSAMMLLLFNGSQARADVVLGELVQWNLDIANAQDAGKRGEIYAARLAEMNAVVSKGTLAAEDQKVAATLLENAQAMTKTVDPLAEGERFVEIAQEIEARAVAEKDQSAGAGLEKVYQHVVQDGVKGRVQSIDPAKLAPAKQTEWKTLEQNAKQLSPGASNRVQVGTSRIVLGGGGSSLPANGGGNVVVYLNAGTIGRSSGGGYVPSVGQMVIGPVGSSGGVTNWTAAGSFWGGGGTVVQTRVVGGGYGNRTSEPAAESGASSPSTAAANGATSSLTCPDHGNPRDGSSTHGDGSTANNLDMDPTMTGRPPSRNPAASANAVNGNMSGDGSPAFGKLPAKGYGEVTVATDGDDSYGKSGTHGLLPPPPPMNKSDVFHSKPSYGTGGGSSMGMGMDADDGMPVQTITGATSDVQTVADVGGDATKGKKFHRHMPLKDEGDEKQTYGSINGDDAAIDWDKADLGDRVDFGEKGDGSWNGDGFAKKYGKEDEVATDSGEMMSGFAPTIAVMETVATPEPGSGLLVMLGGVILLRRRRAERV